MALKDGLYRVHFQTPLGWGSGILHALGGRLWGGDAAMYYVGTYSEMGADGVAAEIRIGRHTRAPGITSVFGRDDVRLTLRGAVSADTARFTGTAAEVPNVTFSAEIARISD